MLTVWPFQQDWRGAAQLGKKLFPESLPTQQTGWCWLPAAIPARAPARVSLSFLWASPRGCLGCLPARRPGFKGEEADAAGCFKGYAWNWLLVTSCILYWLKPSWVQPQGMKKIDPASQGDSDKGLFIHHTALHIISRITVVLKSRLGRSHEFPYFVCLRPRFRALAWLACGR